MGEKTPMQVTLQGRQQAEERIRQLLGQLEPNGEIEGTLLQRYYPSWAEPRDIPSERLDKVGKSLAGDVQVLKALGEEKYFATLTAKEKLALYLRALTLVEMVITESSTVDPHHPITWRDFKDILTAGIKAASSWPDGTEAPLFHAETAPPSPPKQKSPRKKTGATKGEMETVRKVVDYLNQKTGRVFRPGTAGTRDKIVPRLREGFTLPDFQRVIDNRCAKWNHPPECGQTDMREYLRPSTLFGTNFESYLNADAQTPETRTDKPNPMAATEYIPLKERQTHETAQS